MYVLICTFAILCSLKYLFMEDILMPPIGKFFPGKGTLLKCENCGQKFYGRSDRKYCSSHCKNKKNNDRAKQKREATSHEENIMRKNYEILKELYEYSLGKTGLPLAMMQNKGFDFKAPARISKLKDTGEVIHWQHGYGYSYKQNDETVKIYKDERS